MTSPEPDPPPTPSMLVRAAQGVTLAGAGPIDGAVLRACLERAPVAVAADGGAQALLEAGQEPRAVIGDLDSLPAAARRAIPRERIHRIAEQDSTDFEKCLARIEAPLILAPGFLEGRADHALAALSTLARSGWPRCVLVSRHDAVCQAPPRLALDLAPGTRVSLFPMTGVRGTSEGLRWPIAGIDFAPGGRIGTSNEALGPVRLAMEGAGMLVAVPLAALDALIAGLMAQPQPGGRSAASSARTRT